MTVKEYFVRKDAIVRKRYNADVGIIDTDSNVTEVVQWHLSMESAATQCPHCMVYWELQCEGCPTALKYGRCGDVDSKSERIGKAIRDSSTGAKLQDIAPELAALIAEYNKDLDEGRDNGLV